MKKLPKISLFESSDIENLNLAKSQSRIESGYIDDIVISLASNILIIMFIRKVL